MYRVVVSGFSRIFLIISFFLFTLSFTLKTSQAEEIITLSAEQIEQVFNGNSFDLYLGRGVGYALIYTSKDGKIHTYQSTPSEIKDSSVKRGILSVGNWKIKDNQLCFASELKPNELTCGKMLYSVNLYKRKSFFWKFPDTGEMTGFQISEVFEGDYYKLKSPIEHYEVDISHELVGKTALFRLYQRKLLDIEVKQDIDRDSEFYVGEILGYREKEYETKGFLLKIKGAAKVKTKPLPEGEMEVVLEEHKDCFSDPPMSYCPNDIAFIEEGKLINSSNFQKLVLRIDKSVNIKNRLATFFKALNLSEYKDYVIATNEFAGDGKRVFDSSKFDPDDYAKNEPKRSYTITKA